MLQSTLTGPVPDPTAGVPQAIEDVPRPRRRPRTTGSSPGAYASVGSVRRSRHRVRMRARPASSTADELRLQPGARVGRYVIERQLGHGGMGVVYGARDRALGRRVALKLVRHRANPRPYDVQFTERLRREARALARLSHPNVVGLYDLGHHDRVLFLAMQFIDGEHLARTLARDRPGWRRVLSLFGQAGAGLSAAHAAGIIHRDFKPSNVIVGPDEHVTVVDFGLARATATEMPEDADDSGAILLAKKLTDVNVILGTRAYMAPEQLLGRPVSPAADQFSFCVSLFEALFDARPYAGRTALEIAKSFATQALTEIDDLGDVPEYVYAALVRGLSIEPEDRFASMDALLQALSPPPPRRRRWPVPAAIVTSAVVSAALTAWITAKSSSPRPAPARDQAPASAVDPAPRR